MQETTFFNKDANDLAAVSESARVISECINHTELLEKLASVILQTSSADRLVLLLPDLDGTWYERVIALTADTKSIYRPLTESNNLPIELIESVSRNQKILPDGYATPASPTNTFFNGKLCKSVLCLPLIHQSRTVGILYLEHQTRERVFSDRITVLTILCAQMATAIENQRLAPIPEQESEIPDASFPYTSLKETEFFHTSESLPGFMYRIKITPDDEVVVLHVTSNCEVVYEVSAESLMNGQHSLSDFVHEEDRSRVDRQHREAGMSTEPSDYEFRIVTASGNVKWVSVTGRAKCRLPDGSIICDGIAIDISARKSVEHRLHDAQIQLKTVTDNLPGMVFRYLVRADASMSVLYLSPQVRELFELEIDEVLADIDLVNTRIHPKDIESVERKLRDIRKSADCLESIQLEYRVILPRKGLRWLQSVRRVSRTEKGETIWDGVVIDVTERKEAQSRLRLVTDNMPGMVFRYIARADGSWAALHVSQQVREIFEHEIEEVIADFDLIRKRIHPDDLQSLINDLTESENGSDPIQSEFRVVLPQQGVRWRRSLRRASRTEDGDTIWDGVVIDITDHKNSELALRESETKFQRTTENIPGMVYRSIVRADGSTGFIHVSPKSIEMFGATPEEILKDEMQVARWIRPEDLKCLIHQSQLGSDIQSQQRLEFRVLTPDKGARWYEVYRQPNMLLNGDMIWDGVVLDITDRKHTELYLQQANESLARATKMKDEFLANMSHELRTPLTAILASAEGLQHGVFGEMTEQQSESATIIHDSGLHLLELINEILDLAKIESGSLKLELTNIDITEICESSLQMVSQQAREKSIELALKVQFNPPLLQADETRVRQIIVNLLSNAVKFTSSGGRVTLRVECVASTNKSGNGFVRFLVEDTGSGIPETKLDSLFKPFVQIQTSLNRENGGTGLGLALVKQFAELHGGTTSVSSEVGVGSCFSVDLPLRQKGYTSVYPTLHRKRDGVPLIENRTATDHAPLILLAEDNESVGNTTCRYLESVKFRVHWVKDGRSAVEAALKLEPDVILMDIQMPGVDGLQAIRELRKASVLEETPVVALTGLAMLDDANRCLAAGASNYLSKPYRMKELVDLVQQLLKHEEA